MLVVKPTMHCYCSCYDYIYTAIGTSASAVEYEGLDPTEHEWINASTDADVDTIHRLLMVDPTLVNRKVTSPTSVSTTILTLMYGTKF